MQIDILPYNWLDTSSFATSKLPHRSYCVRVDSPVAAVPSANRYGDNPGMAGNALEKNAAASMTVSWVVDWNDTRPLCQGITATDSIAQSSRPMTVLSGPAVRSSSRTFRVLP